RSFHLAFWLLLSFARAALVHLNAIGCSLAPVSERPDPPGCEAQGGPGLVTCPAATAGADDQLTNAALAAWFGARRCTENKESPGRARTLVLSNWYFCLRLSKKT